MTPTEAQQLAAQAAALFDQNQFDEAEQHARTVIAAYPKAPRALQVVGFVQMRRGQNRDAIESLNRALAAQPDLAISHNGLGLCHERLGEHAKARYHYDRALMLNPNYPVAHYNRGQLLLKLGEYREGWIEYEWRWIVQGNRGPQLPCPRWDGSPLNGRSILIHTEQGVGDAMMMVRLFPLLKAQGCRLVFACQKAIKKLLECLPEVDSWFPIGEPAKVDFDIYASLLSLPGLLQLNESTIPRHVPYLRPDPALVEAWRPRIHGLPGFKVGVCWQGSPTYENDDWRSIPLKLYAAFAEVPGVTLVCLQKHDGLDQTQAVRDEVPMVSFPEMDANGAFTDTAAIVQHLDLVITPDTALGHLTGALGRPGWVMLSAGCDWRWGENAAGSFWYPSLRLFRQNTFGDWLTVIAEAAEALRAAVAGGPVAPPQAVRATAVEAPVAAGEVIDKITILQIKVARIEDAAKLVNVRKELDQLSLVWKMVAVPSAELDAVVTELKQANETLWEVEDDIRRCEATGDFGETFVALARSVYRTNDRRSALKRRVNDLLGSAIVEEKSYASGGE